jgi:hypothetical protein
LKVWEVGEGERERERPSLKSVLSGWSWRLGGGGVEGDEIKFIEEKYSREQ